MNELQTVEWRGHDFDELAASLSRWDQVYKQLSAGKFNGGLRHLLIDGMEVFQLHWGQSIRYQGLAPPGTIGFGLPLSLDGEARYLNNKFRSDVLLVQPLGAEGDLIGSRDFHIWVLTVNQQQLMRVVAETTGMDANALLSAKELAGKNYIPLAPADAQRARAQFASLIRLAFNRTAANAATDALVAIAAHDLLRRIAIILSGQKGDPTTLRQERQRVLLRKSEDYILSQPTVVPRIADLCASLGTSERTLRDAFKNCTGMNLNSYLKAFRLNQTRAALKAAAADQATVRDVAFDWGFWHLGQFAADYKRLFGEPPSQTLHHFNGKRRHFRA